MAGRPATLRVDIIGNARKAIAAVRRFGDSVNRQTAVVRRSARAMATTLAGITAASSATAIAAGAAFAALTAGAAAAAVGVAGLGIAVAAQTDQVRDAFSGIGDQLRGIVTEASAGYVPLLTSFAGELRGVIDGPVKDALSSVLETALPVAEAFLAQVAPLTDLLAPVFTRIVEAGAPVAILFAEQLVPRLESLIGIVESVTGAIAPFVDTIGTALQGALIDIGPALGPFLTALLELGTAVLPPLLAVLGGVVRNLLNGLTPAIGELVPILPQLVLSFGQILVALVPLIPAVVQLIAALAPVVTIVVQLAAELVQVLVPAIVAVVNWLTSLLPAASSVTGPLGSVRSVSERISSFWTGTLVPAAQRVYDWFVREIAPGIRSGLQPALDAARSAFNDVKAAIDRNRPTIEALQRNFQRVRTVLGPVVSFLSGTVARVIGGTLTAQFRILGGAISFVIDIVSAGVRAFDRLLSAASSAASAARNVTNLLPFSGPPLATFSGAGGPGALIASTGLTAALGGLPSSSTGLTVPGFGAPAIVQNRYQVVVNGALDPVEVGRQIERILDGTGRTFGRSVPGFVA